MRFDFALIADAAQVVEGKLYVQGGGITRLTVPSVPWMQPIAICMRLAPDAGDDLSEEWQFGLSVIDPDGAPTVEHHTPITLNVPETEVAEGEQQTILVALTLNGLVVHRHGPHRVRLSINGADTELPFAVVPPTT